MKRLIPTILVLLLMSGSVYADDYQDGIDAIEREDYKTAFEKFKLLAEQGHAPAQRKLSLMYLAGWEFL
jgi:TPR repeat protein